MADSDAGKLQYNLITFTFRGQNGITIDPSIIDGIYEIAVDIVIESTDGNEYQSSKSLPPKGFYGYATLVQDDCLELEIPVHFPRQRIYEEKILEALNYWSDVRIYYGCYKKWMDFWYALLGAGAGGELPEVSVILPVPQFISTRLTEVYYNPADQQQWRIEVSYYTPIPFTDNNGNSYTGSTSNLGDTKKMGLPGDGIAPKTNSPSAPYTGNKPANGTDSHPSWVNSKIPNFPNVDPDNEPSDVPATSTTDGYYFALNVFFLTDDQGGANVGVWYIPCTSEATLHIEDIGSPFVVAHNNTSVQQIDISLSDGTLSDTVNILAGNTVSGALEYGKLPQNTYQNLPGQW